MKKMLALLLCLMIVISSTACKKTESNANSAIATAEYPKKDLTNKDELRNKDFINTVNQFSYLTTSKLFNDNSKNATYSPFSLFVALSVAASGANGVTKDELFQLLGVEDSNYLSEENRKLYQLLYSDDEIGKLKIANSLWLRKGSDFEDSFIDNAVGNFYTSLYSVDFTQQKTADLMSQWIFDNTNGLIKPDIKISGNRVLSIINTIYLKDEWMEPFSENSTEKGEFHLSNGTNTEVEYMNKTLLSNPYIKGHGFTSSTLDLKTLGKMVFVLPDEGVSIEELLSSPEKIAQMFSAERTGNAKVIFKLPKFKFGSKFDLIDPLKELGVNSAFGDGADFTGITKTAPYISAITQETFVSIDEKGVEAAAYTEIAMDESAPMEEETTIEMTLDKPFIFAITSQDGVLLFIGVANNPADSE